MLNDPAPLLRLEGVTRDYGNGRGVFDATLEILPGRVLGVIGANGSGKTTLLRCATLFDPIDQGQVTVGGNCYGAQARRSGGLSVTFDALASSRGRAFSAVFQHSQPWPHLNVEDNVLLPLLRLGLSKDEARRRCEVVLDELGLMDRASSRPWELSGGLRQRVVLARALALDTPLLLLDEATSALDPDWTEQVREMLRARTSDGKGVMVVSHQMGFIRRISDEVVFLHRGKVRERGHPRDVLSNPSSEELVRLLANA